MSTGSLLFPIGHVFLDDNGTPVNAGKLYVYRTGTTTPADTFSDSTLDTANSNPIVLNSAGRSTTAIYGDPSSGFDLRLRLSTSADSQIWQYDDVKVDGAATATYSEGSFTGTLTGMTASTTGDVSYKIFGNSDGTGKLCALRAGAISGTSNTTAMTMTGLPAAVQPSETVWLPTLVLDNGSDVSGAVGISGSTITFYVDSPLSSTGFTASGTKGLTGAWSLIYPL